MDRQSVTPEETVLNFSVNEIIELLDDLGLDASIKTAVRLKHLVRSLNNLEQAIGLIGGPVTMRNRHVG